MMAKMRSTDASTKRRMAGRSKWAGCGCKSEAARALMLKSSCVRLLSSDLHEFSFSLTHTSYFACLLARLLSCLWLPCCILILANMSILMLAISSPHANGLCSRALYLEEVAVHHFLWKDAWKIGFCRQGISPEF